MMRLANPWRELLRTLTGALMIYVLLVQLAVAALAGVAHAAGGLADKGSGVICAPSGLEYSVGRDRTDGDIRKDACAWGCAIPAAATPPALSNDSMQLTRVWGSLSYSEARIALVATLLRERQRLPRAPPSLI